MPEALQKLVVFVSILYRAPAFVTTMLLKLNISKALKVTQLVSILKTI